MPPRVHDPALGLHISGTRVQLFEDCKRKWAFQYIGTAAEGPIVVPPSEALLRGTALHWVAENWFKRATLPHKAPLCPVDPTVLPEENTEAIRKKRQHVAATCFTTGIRHWPAPKTPAVMIEFPTATKLVNGGTFTGTLDYFDLRNTRRPLVGDHKSTRDFKWAKTAEQLVHDTQAGGYAHQAMRETGAKEIELQWVYYRTVGRPASEVRRATLHEDQILETWDRIEKTSSRMLKLYEDRVDPMQLEPNHDTCQKFGGCPFRERCGRLAGGDDIMEGSALFKALKEKGKKAEDAPPPAASSGADDDVFGTPAPAVSSAGTVAAAQAPITGVATGINPPPRTPAPKKDEAAGLKAALSKVPKPAAEPPAAAPNPAEPQEKEAAAEPATMRKPMTPKRIAVVGLSVFVDCIPLKGFGPARTLIDVLGPAFQRAAELQGVPNWRLIEFGKGDGVVASCAADMLDGGDITGAVLVDSGTKEGRAVMGVLEQYADVFVRKLG